MLIESIKMIYSAAMMHTGTEAESQTKCSGLLGDTKLWFCGGLFQLEFFRCKFDWCVEASSALDVAVNTFISWHTIGGKEMNNQMMQPVVRVHLIRQFCWWTLLRFSFASHTFRLLYFILLLSPPPQNAWPNSFTAASFFPSSSDL